MPIQPTSKRLCALIAALMLVAFAGCGDDDSESSGASTEQTETSSSASGGDTQQYKQEFRSAGEEFKDAAQRASDKVQSATGPNARAQALVGLKEAVTDAADNFEGLDPPAEVEPANDKLVSQFRGVAREVDAVREALESTDPAAAQAAAQRLQQAQAAIGKTLASIESEVGN